MSVLVHRSSPATQIEDIAGLYTALSARLERLVRSEVRAPDAVIEDACQSAWSRLIQHAGGVRRDAVLSWLATTAVREALKLIGRRERDLSLDAALEQGSEAILATWAPGPDELVERRERLDALAVLPERQQRLVWLHASGLSYAEMASYTGYSQRTVERQLLRAKCKIRIEGL
jgi:RNA polymerase sigma factor (sigma-70 family)